MQETENGAKTVLYKERHFFNLMSHMSDLFFIFFVEMGQLMLQIKAQTIVKER